MGLHTDFSLYYFYKPNVGASIAFCVFFAASMVVHIYQCFKFKSWRITFALSWAALLFVVGFAMHTASIYNDHNLDFFIADNVFLLVAPPIYSLMNYIVLARTLYYVPYLSPIHPGRVLSTFIGIDVVIGALTGNGASYSANTNNPPSQIKMGRDLIRASIILQLAAFVGFIVLEVVLHQRLLKARIMNPKLRMIIVLLYTSSVLILIRNIYRVVAVWEGFEGELQTHEAYFYVLDATLMLINSTMLNVWHPMNYLPHDNKVYLSPDGVTERLGPGWADKRPFLLTLFDPFDIGGLIRGKDNKDKFWEEEMKPEEVPRTIVEPNKAV